MLITQLLGATNDNIFRWLVIGVGKQYIEGDPAPILTGGTACFVLPYLILAAPAGYLADRFSKRTVIVYCKVGEIVIMALGMVAIVMGSLWGLFAVLTLMGAQSALFSPSKAGSIPEMLPVEKISAANGLFGLTTVVATAMGQAVGSFLSDWTTPKGQSNWWLSASVLLGVAGVGWICSLAITRLPIANPSRTFPWDAPRQTARDLRKLASNLPLRRVALGIMFFWSLGTLATLNIDQFSFEGGASGQADGVPLLLALVLGVGLGSVLAGVLSRGKIELRMIPLGAGGIVASLLLFFVVPGPLFDVGSGTTISFYVSCVLLLALGTSAGFYNVPLEAFIQHRSPTASRGSILAASNFLTFLGILGASACFWVLRHPESQGTWDDMAVVATAKLSPKAEARIRRIETAYENQWQPSEKVHLPRDLEGLSGQEREVLLARLLWIDITRRKESGEPIIRHDYLKQFHDDREIAAEIYDHVMGRPLCTARQIFLLSGILTIPVLMYIGFLSRGGWERGLARSSQPRVPGRPPDP